MLLNLENGQSIDQPDDEAIATAIRSLKDEFAILGTDPESEDEAPGFIQASGGPDSFVVEYRETDEAAGKERQFQSAEDQPTDTVIQLFRAYARGDPSYKTAIAWNVIIEEPTAAARDVARQKLGDMPDRRRGCLTVLVLAGAAAAAVAFLAGRATAM